MTKMAAMPTYVKNSLKIFSRAKRLMNFKLGIQHRGLLPYTFYTNDDPGLTLTFFTARSKLLPNAFVWENSRFYRNLV